MADKGYKIDEWALNGKLITSRDAATIGKNNFQALTNLRYTDTHPKGIGGMSKINTNALTNAKIRSGFHFRKDSPSESHVLVQSFNSGETQGYIYDNETAVPSAGNFNAAAVLTQESTAETARWSTAPNGYVAMCDGAGTYVWGGDEAKIAALITSTATVTDSITNPRVFTHEVQNTINTNEESAVIGGGDDSNTVLLLHNNGDDGEAVAIADSSSGGPGGNADTVGGNAQLDTDQAKFGQSSLLLDGAGDYIAFNDAATWNFSNAEFEIDTWVRFSSVANQMCIYSQGTGTSYIALIQDHGAGKLWFTAMSAGTRVVHESGSWSPSADTWYHVAVIRGWGAETHDWAITVDGSPIATFTNSGTLPDVGAEIQIGNMAKTVFFETGNTGHGFVTQAGDPTLSSDQQKFGSGSLYLTNDALYTADSDDYDIQTNFTLSLFVKHTDHAGTETYLCQFEDVNNMWELLHANGSGLNFQVWSGGVSVVDTGSGGEITDTDWHHVALCKVGDDYGLYLDGTQVAHTNDASTDTFAGAFYLGSRGNAANFYEGYMDEVIVYHGNLFGAAPDAGLTDTITVPTSAATSDSNTKFLGHFDTLDLDGRIDEFRISKSVSRRTSAFTPDTRPYSASALYWVVGSVLPLTGVKFYIKTPNTETSEMTVKEWNGYSWSSLTANDNTASSGVSLAQTGTVTWSTTESTSRVKYLQGSVLYWYQFSISAGNADIYHATVTAPMQEIKDLWNGIERECLAFFHVDDGDYHDLSVNVFDDSYDSTNTATYAELDSLVVADDYLLCGFDERMMGVNVSIIKSNNDGAAGNIGLTVKYWNGTGWATPGGLVDETAISSKSFDQTGIIHWTPPEREEEFRTDIQTGIPLYYYKFEFDTTNFGNEVEVYYISGVPAPKHLHSFGFPVHAGSALWLLADQDEDKNRIVRCAPNTISFWNGDEALEVFVGDDNELTAGAAVYIQLGSNLYEVVLVCKKHEAWMLVPGDDNTVQKFRISDKVGCVAPSTMRACHLGSLEAGTARSVVMWQGAEGIYLFDGKAPVKISEDIDDLFDKNNSDGLNRTYIDDSYGEFDVERWEYRWLCRTGTSATWDEYVYDLKRGKWYQVSRGTGKALKCAISVMSTGGNFYTYGGIETGYLERLENGTAFDGNDIVHTLTTGDFVLNNGVISEKALVRQVKLVGKATNTTSNTIAANYYKDGSTTSNESFTLTPQASGKRIFQDSHGMGAEGRAVFHTFNYSMTTDDETVGFEPMFMSVLYKTGGIDKGA